MTKRVLPVSGILNELRGSSLYFMGSSAQSSPLAPPDPKLSGEPLHSHIEMRDEDSKKLDMDTPPFLTKTELPIAETNQSPKERSNERANERFNEYLNVRRKIRHTFDIFADQLLSLREMAIEDEKYTGGRVLIGDLAQQAFDMFITKHRNK